MVIVNPIANSSTSGWGPLPTFNLVVKFVQKLKNNQFNDSNGKATQFEEFQHKSHENLRETYACMKQLITMTHGVTKTHVQF